MSQPKHFLIAGGTGRQGGAVVKALLTNPDFDIKPTNMYAITRSPTGSAAQHLISTYPGINIVSGDLNNPQALFLQLDPLILASTAIFLAQSHGPTEVSDATGFINAATENKIPYFVYSSVDRGGREISDVDPSYCKTFSDKFLIETHLRTITSQNPNMDYTILRPTWFADNASWGFPGKLCMAGWKVWMGGKKMQVVTTTDIGRWAAEALVRPDKFEIRNQALSVASDELNFEEVDEMFRRKTGQGVPVVNGWLACGIIWCVRDLRTMFNFIGERQYGADLEWLGERIKPVSFEKWVDSLTS